jgi:hypothetical protein
MIALKKMHPKLIAMRQNMYAEVLRDENSEKFCSIRIYGGRKRYLFSRANNPKDKCIFITLSFGLFITCRGENKQCYVQHKIYKYV